MSVSEVKLLLLALEPIRLPEVRIVVFAPDGSEFVFSTIGVNVLIDGQGETVKELIDGTETLSTTGAAWEFLVVDFAGLRVAATLPGEYKVAAQFEGNELEAMGSFWIIPVTAPPLTPERIQAIRSDPQATKAIRFEYGCQSCASQLKVYSSLDRQDEKFPGFSWYADLPAAWKCSCGKATTDLQLVRSNMFNILGGAVGEKDRIGKASRLYEEGSIEKIASRFGKLLDAEPAEEQIQRFIERNSILWHFFTPQSIYIKKPILSFFKTDFALLTGKRELLLVEIERAQTRLLKSDGGMASDLQHAFDQVHSWLNQCDNHKPAILTAYGLRSEDVGSIRGVVIAGRDQPYDKESLRALKCRDFGRVSFYTYDDLLGALVSTLRELRRL